MPPNIFSELSMPLDLDKLEAEITRPLLLQEREKTHGSFHENARIWVALNRVVDTLNMPKPEHKLALNMIFLKIARVALNPETADSWKDISGYALLAEEACDNS